jgi:hypothetical protein
VQAVAASARGPRWLSVIAQNAFVHPSSRQGEDRLGRIFFSGRKTVTVELNKLDANDQRSQRPKEDQRSKDQRSKRSKI